MTRLRIYGDPKRFRARLAKKIDGGQHLLQQIEGAQLRLHERAKDYPDGEESRLLAALRYLDIVGPIERSVENWGGTNRRVLDQFLGPEGAATYRAVEARHPRVDGPDLSPIAEFVRAWVQVFRSVEQSLPSQRAITQRVTVEHPLDDLRSSGMFDASTIDDFEDRLSGLGNRRRWRRAIGGSKELVEALHRGVLDTLGATAPPRDVNFVKLGKLARDALYTELEAQSIGSAKVDRAVGLERSLASLLQALTELRNEEGDGHGRTRVNRDLSRRHVQLAIDSSLAYVRFLLDAMNEAGVLPPLDGDVRS